MAVLAFLLPVLLVGGLWLGGHPEHLPSFLRKAFVANHSTLVVDEAIRRIAEDYYRPIPTSKLNDASISGVVKSLDDRFSHYLTKSEFEEFISPPHFAGIGVIVDPLHRGLLIARVFDASPASRAGLKPGELIVGVGSRKLVGLSAEGSTALIRGQPGTAVQLQVEAGQKGHAHTRSVTITRGLTLSRSWLRLPGPSTASMGVVALEEFSAGAHGEVREAVEKLLQEKAEGDRLRPARQRRRPRLRGAADRKHLPAAGRDRCLHAANSRPRR